MKNKYSYPLILAVVLACGMWVGWLLSRQHSYSTSEQKLLRVLSIIRDQYVDPLDMDSLVERAIPSLIKGLDPHSSYIPVYEREEVNTELAASISGIGVLFQVLNDTVSVIEVTSGSPAEKVGMMPGDRIVRVDTIDVVGESINPDYVRSLIRGEKGTMVKITVKRTNSRKPLIFDIVRDDVPLTSIDAAYMIDDETGYIKVSKFARMTYPEFLQALTRLRIDGATGYILDLRGNTGGFMEPAVLMANEFLEPGRVIVSTRGRNPQDNDVIVSDGAGAFSNFNLVILIDEFSASSSEIFTGAMQDNDRAWVIGRRSFGKGLVQTQIELPDSSEMRLTIQRYYTPAGRSIQKDYTLGDKTNYEMEIINRYNSGELLSADSVKLNLNKKYITVGGREVYGGGGIMPDYFVPNDTSGVTSYYINVVNSGLLNKFAYEYADLNRADLSDADDVDQLLKKLPSDGVLLSSFVNYAALNGVPARWYYINNSATVIVNQLKALIARDILGSSAYYRIMNSADKTVEEALRHINKPIN